MSEQAQTIEHADPAAPPDAASGDAGETGAPMDLAAIEAVRDSDIDRYFSEGLDTQWKALKDAEAAEAEKPTFTLDDLRVIDAPTDADADPEADDEIADDQSDADAEADGEETYPHVDAVPETADAYRLPEVEGFEWDDDAKEGLTPYLEQFHELEIPQSAANRLLEVYASQQAAVQARDESDVKSAREALVSELGSQEAYKATITKVASFVEGLGDLGLKIAEARAPDGTRLVNDPTYVKLLKQLSETRGEPTGSRSAPVDNYSPSEEDQLVSLMNSDVGTFMAAPWRNTGVTASQRLLQLRRGATKS
jgi:hypothetical protein